MEKQGRRLPQPPEIFNERKTKILEQLAVPDQEYTDASPKGTVDVGIRNLIDEINCTDGFVTTSSCAGRVSVFLEGRKAPASVAETEADADDDERLRAKQVAGVGGKGAGGTWLYVSHDPVSEGDDWVGALGLIDAGEDFQESQGKRLIHFKFEPMILHVLTASPKHAQLLLQSGLQAGFRESGAINIASSIAEGNTTPIVAIRSMGLSFESLIGYESQDGSRHSLVPRDYLSMIMDIGNGRFSENTKRIERFRSAFHTLSQEPEERKNPEGRAWEDAATRRERMRAEGLQRKAEAMSREKGPIEYELDMHEMP